MTVSNLGAKFFTFCDFWARNVEMVRYFTSPYILSLYFTSRHWNRDKLLPYTPLGVGTDNFTIFLYHGIMQQNDIILIIIIKCQESLML